MVRPPSQELLDDFAAYDPQVARLALALRAIVLEEAPLAIESVAKGYALAIGFSFTGKPLKDGFCYVAAYRRHVNLGFNRGALLPDPTGALAGTGKLFRHLTLHSDADLDSPLLRRFLQAAIEQVAPTSTRGSAASY